MIRQPKVVVREFHRSSDLSAVLEIARLLPEWFTPKGIRFMEADLKFQSGLVAVHDNRITGFISFFVNQGKAEIGWMGVRPDVQRNGIGRMLVSSLAQHLRPAEINEVYVHTLGDAVEYEPYRKTRAFYRGIGFRDFRRISQPDNPECEEDLVLLLKLDEVNV